MKTAAAVVAVVMLAAAAWGSPIGQVPMAAAECEMDKEAEPAEGVPFRTLNPPDGYDDPATLTAYFEGAAAANSDIAMLIDLTETYDAPPTHEGQHIFAMKISDNVTVDEDEMNQLYVANHHCREMITPQLARDTAERLIAGYRANDPRITAVVNEYQTYVIWTQNPDGLDYVWEVNNMWRKNRRDNGGSFGVDLNRNYPVGWDSSCGGSSNPSSDTYRGPSPGSEPETVTMMRFQEDRNFAKLIDWHSYARDTRPGYGQCGLRDASMSSLWNSVGSALADQMEAYRLGSSCCMAGDIHNLFESTGGMSVLIETGTSFQPSEPAMRDELVRVWPGTLWYMELPVAVVGHVTDTSGSPLVANFAIAGVDYYYDEPSNWHSSAAFGRYHLWLPTGTYAVTASAPGCQAQTLQVASDPIASTNTIDFVLSC